MDTSAADAVRGDGPRDPAQGRIGLFGGTFDPVHFGHLRIALDAIEHLGLDQVRLIPLAEAVHREQPQAPPTLRVQMLNAAVSAYPQLVIDEREVRRSGPSYTVDTVVDLAEEFPDATLCVLVGSDAFASLQSWRTPERILELANLAVMQRPGEREPQDDWLRELLAQHATEALRPGRNGQILRLQVTQLDISSSDIRARVQGGRSPAFLVPDAVLGLIEQHRLYRSG